MFVLCVFAFATAFYVVFSADAKSVKTLSDAMGALLRMMIGDFDYSELSEVSARELGTARAVGTSRLPAPVSERLYSAHSPNFLRPKPDFTAGQSSFTAVLGRQHNT